jgi:hypothetical protein
VQRSVRGIVGLFLRDTDALSKWYVEGVTELRPNALRRATGGFRA